MLDFHYLKKDYAVSYGSATLKSLQNSSVPELDLLVREAIQNSSDASLRENDHNNYIVNFNTGSFTPSNFNKYLDTLADVLNEKYSDISKAEYLEIRDKNTSGLTGHVKKEDIYDNPESIDHGNFSKLIYDTGKEQTNEHAGGNWGFGKSVYYRVGIGLVVFYSRIKIKTDDSVDSYEDRLIVTLIEDESKRDSEGHDVTLLGPIVRRYAGKAWWGFRSGNVDNNDDNMEDILPITDLKTIREILDVFGLKPFDDDETGTSIIIPYIDSTQLLDNVINDENDEQRGNMNDVFRDAFTGSLSDYLKLAVQKWYAPKINNIHLALDTFDNIEPESRKRLDLYFDDVAFGRQDMLRFFRLVQELYTCALAQANGCIYSSEEFPEIHTYDVCISRYLDGPRESGCVSAIWISKNEIFDECSGLSPYNFIGMPESDNITPDPVIMYAREPGMVINYDTKKNGIGSSWTNSLHRPRGEGVCLFAFFVPIFSKAIRNDNRYDEFKGKTLGVYLRKCEASDHFNWVDCNGMKIVHSIQVNTRACLDIDSTQDGDETINAEPNRLSDRLGRSLQLLKPDKNDKSNKSRFGSSSSGGSSSGNRVMLVVDNLKMQDGDILIDFTLKKLANKKITSIWLAVDSESKLIDVASWNKYIGTQFPVYITQCVVSSVVLCNGDAGQNFDPIQCDKDCNRAECEALSVLLCSEVENGSFTKAVFDFKKKLSEFKARIVLRTNDKKYAANLLAK